MAALKIEIGGGVGDIALMMLDGAEDELALELVDELTERDARPVDLRLASAFAEMPEGAELALADRLKRREDDEPLDEVAKLAHIAGKIVFAELFERLL